MIFNVLRNILAQLDVPQRQQQNRVQETQVQTQVNNAEITQNQEQVDPMVYRQYLVNTSPQTTSNFHQVQANGNDEFLHEVFEMDREAFSELDPYNSFEEFKSFVENSNFSTYLIKDNNDTTIGYYQLEPIKNGDLYIDSIALKPEYRTSRAGYRAINQFWEEIQNYAQENNVQTMSLHVDATNRSLVRLYQNLGFVIKETLPNYYENGAQAYFMEKPLVQNLQETQNEPVETETQPEEVVQTQQVDEPEQIQNETEVIETEQNEQIQDEPEVVNNEQIEQVEEIETSNEQVQEVENLTVEAEIQNPEPIVDEATLQQQNARAEFSEKYQKAVQELRELGFDKKSDIDSIIKECTTLDKANTCAVFNDELYNIGKRIITTINEKYPDDGIGMYFKIDDYQKIMSIAVQKDDKGNIQKIHPQIPDYLDKLVTLGVSHRNLSETLTKCIETDKSGNKSVDFEALDYILSRYSIFKGDKNNDISRILRYCTISKSNGETYIDKDALEMYYRYLLNPLKDGLSYASLYSPEHIIGCGMRYENYENNYDKYFDKELCKKIIRYFEDTSIPSYEKAFNSPYDADSKRKDGIDLELYMKYYNKINDDKELKLSYDDKVKTIWEIIKACSFEDFEIKTNYLTNKNEIKKVPGWDFKAFSTLKEYAKENNNTFGSIKNLAQIINACKVKPDTLDITAYKFDMSLFEKALELKSLGLDGEKIPKVLEACKMKNKPYIGLDHYSLTFSNEMYEAYKNELKNSHRDSSSVLRYCVNTIDGKEVFVPKNYEYLKDYREPASSMYGEAWNAFYKNNPRYLGDPLDRNKYFDLDLFKEYIEINQPELRLVCDKNRNNNGPKYLINRGKIQAYKELIEKDVTFTPKSGWTQDKNDMLIDICSDDVEDYNDTRFNPTSFRKMMNLIENGMDGADAYEMIYDSKVYHGKLGYHVFAPIIFNKAVQLMEKGIDSKEAVRLVKECYNVDSDTINMEKLNRYIELYELGSKSLISDLSATYDTTYKDVRITKQEFNEVAYDRVKQCIKRGLDGHIVSQCKDNGVFKDRQFKLAMQLADKGYSSNYIRNLMLVCHDKLFDPKEDSTSRLEFNYDTYLKIEELEKSNLDEENIYKLLKACSPKEKFVPELYDKIKVLQDMDYDTAGIAKFITLVGTKGEFDEQRYNQLLELTKDHKLLKGRTYDDEYVIEKLNSNVEQIKKATETFGQDVMTYALSSRIDGFIDFTKLCNNIINNCSNEFVKDLTTRLDSLPSPELKMKRLRTLGSLADKVKQKGIEPLVEKIQSPKMSKEQMDLANKIFTTDEEYEVQVYKFLTEFNVPQKTRQSVYDYLMKAKLNEQIDWKKPIEEQKAQMDTYAQQMLTNPKIPLEKKLKYIDEFKARKADMEANPDKYTTPVIFAKPMQNLAKVVMAYVNIPNDDAKFNNAITESMYAKFGITTTPELLQEIHYDSKYFDRLFQASTGFMENFPKLIELKKLNPGMKLTDARMTMPEMDSPLYEKYKKLGLIEQIEANLDTKRQFVEQNLNFDYWNKFDKDLKGETFNVEADKDTEYNNAYFYLVNLFQNEDWNNLASSETDELKEHILKAGYAIVNNKIYRNGEAIKPTQLEHFVESVLSYISKSDYFKTAQGKANLELTDIEKDSANALIDHLNDVQHHLKEIRGSQSVQGLYVRLADSDDIGRNIFLGNHVGCCNSVDSSYAGYSAPMHLLNSYVRGIELVDNYGNSYGNSLSFFALVDGKLTYVIDSFEANGKLGSNPAVTEHIYKFAKQLCEKMGCPDAQVMLSPSYNHLSMNGLEFTEGHTIKVLGTTAYKTYCDSIGGKVQSVNQESSNRSMYLFKTPVAQQ